MAGLLGKAKGLWQRDKEPVSEAPPPFSQRCLCGEPIEGYRRREPQTIICPSCNEKVFIFPRSALPAVQNRKRPASKAKSEPSAETTVSSTAPKSVTPKADHTQRKSAHRGLTDGPVESDLTVDDFRKLRRPFWTKPKLIFFGVTIVVIAAIWFQIDRSQRSRLREQLVPSGTEGVRLLAAGKVEEAANQLDIAVKAMDRLGEPVPDEATYRQAHAQAVLLREASGDTLDYQLALAPKEPELIARVMNNRTFVVDAVVEPTPTKGYRVLWHQFLEEQPVIIDATGLELLERLGIEKPTRVVFGARFDKLVREQDSWRLTLLPKSGVLVTEPSIFTMLGAEEDQRKRQKEMFEKLATSPANP